MAFHDDPTPLCGGQFTCKFPSQEGEKEEAVQNQVSNRLVFRSNMLVVVEIPNNHRIGVGTKAYVTDAE